MKWPFVGQCVLVGALLMTLAGCLSSRPRAEFTAVPSSGYPPLEVHFDASGSRSPNGIITNYEWDFDDGETAIGKTAVHTFIEKGVYQVSLAVIDSTGEVGTVYRNVQALSLPPHAEFSVRPNPSTIFFPTDFDASASTDPDGMIVDRGAGVGTPSASPSSTTTGCKARSTGWFKSSAATRAAAGDSGR